MDSIYQWGLELIRTIQRVGSPALTGMMKGLTFLGSEYVYLLLLPLIYWCVDEKKGIRLGLTVILSTWLNSVLKAAFKQPRPFQLDPTVGLITERNYGLPSGHAQMSLTMWGIVASWGKRKWLYGLALLISLLVGFSRLYLGVHFHTDILAGWFLGALVLAVYFLWAGRIEALLVHGGLRAQLIAAALAALLMNALRPDDVTLGAVALGMGGGYALMARFIGFSARQGFQGKGLRRLPVLAARYLIGFAGVALLYTGLRPLMPESGSAYFKLISFCRFIFLQLWIYTGAPWLFLRLRLARRRDDVPLIEPLAKLD